jgi:TrmH family RNA methyltransferase
MPRSSTPVVVTSRTNARVKQLRAAFAARSPEPGALVAIEGENLLQEAIRSGLLIDTVFVSEGLAIPDWQPPATETIVLTAEVFRSAVDTQTPQGVAALVSPPRWAMQDVVAATGQPALLLIAAGLQDPGNLGTLIRSAEAFAATAVLTSPGTVSHWNQKALRASAGSVFRVPVISCTAAEIAAVKSNGVRLLAAVAGSDAAVAVSTANLSGHTALMIGNEGAGLAPEWLDLADERITIPMPGRVESLNAAVAGSLLLYEAWRQRAALSHQPTASNR